MTAKNQTISYDAPVSLLSGVGPKKAEALHRLGVDTIGDLTGLYPRSYEDYRFRKTISQLTSGSGKVMVKAFVLNKLMGPGWGMKRNLRVFAEDSTGRMEVLFFHAAYLAGAIETGKEYCFCGQAKNENGKIIMLHPSFTPAGSEETGIVPVYPLVKGLGQKEMRRYVSLALDAMERTVNDPLPSSLLENRKLCSWSFALRNIHFPSGEDAYKAARYRLIFDEFLQLRLALMLSKDHFGGGKDGAVLAGDGGDRFLASLPYKLTGAQTRVWKEVLADLTSGTAMNRLVQGDVGSGKTVIAEAALCQAAATGHQGAFMAPTEILAAQHYQTLTKDLGPMGLKIVLLTGSLPAKEKRAILEEISRGRVDIVVGTHAVISAGVSFASLGLVITDEQHRFGVNQRKKLEGKGHNPHVMVMTATPIPRTLAVVLFADLDVSVIDELPAGRRTIETRQFDESSRKAAYKLLLQEVQAGHQAYIVAPFIEDSETMDACSAESLYEAFTKKHPQIPAGLLHGAMKQEEKDAVMGDFYKGIIRVLIATVVIEVGINVPDASVMLIENTERFGLAQLHQLRGRVGRGSVQSYCLLVVGAKSETASQRADILCSTSDGFVIAEKDLEIRGPGEFFGFRQHGVPQLQLADPGRHAFVAEDAKRAADALLKDDPTLSKPQNQALAAVISEKFIGTKSLVL